MNKSTAITVQIEQKIYLVRGQKVMFDSDLAALYGASTKRLNEQVKRNLDRFPDDFMFQLTAKELNVWRSQIATSNPKAKMGLRRRPRVFTEMGVAMLSSVLHSDQATKNSEIHPLFFRSIYARLLRTGTCRDNHGRHDMSDGRDPSCGDVQGLAEAATVSLSDADNFCPDSA